MDHWGRLEGNRISGRIWDCIPSARDGKAEPYRTQIGPAASGLGLPISRQQRG